MTARRIAIALGVAIAASGLALAGAALWVHATLHEPWSGWSGAAVVVEIPADSGARRMLARLQAAGVIRRGRLLEAWLSWRGEDRELRAGEYRFDRPVSPLEVVERLRRGDVLLHPVTIPEGLDLMEVARRIEQAGLGASAGLLAAFRDPSAVRDLDPSARDLEGYLFPDTYRFPKGTPPARIARVLVRRFRQVSGSAFGARVPSAGRTLRELVTLASLVEEETARPEERARIARVFLNRLRRGMPLQCDPTVLYALRREGRPVARLSRADLASPSAWNTYRHAGLPPGPICSPGRASLEAALEPPPGPELYFVAAPGGGHRFSNDLRSHERAVREWRRYERSSR